MHKDIDDDPVELAHAESLGYDHRDLPFHKFNGIFIGFFVVTFLFMVMAFVSLNFIYGTVNSKHPLVSGYVEAPKDVPKKAPLQTNISAWKDMQDLRRKEAETKTTYGVSDADKTKVRIPVERAMEKIAEAGPSSLSRNGGNP
jgi:hypothetical protein